MGQEGPDPHPDTHRCDICERPLNPDWARRGYTTHLGCDPATGSHPDPA